MRLVASGNGQWNQYSQWLKQDNTVIVFVHYYDEQSRSYFSVLFEWTGPQCTTLQKIASKMQIKSIQSIMPAADVVLCGQITEQKVRDEVVVARKRKQSQW